MLREGAGFAGNRESERAWVPSESEGERGWTLSAAPLAGRDKRPENPAPKAAATAVMGSLKDYLSALASERPSPGGGSAAALVGSCGVALIEKILRILAGRPAVSRLRRIQLESRLKILSRSSERLRDLIHEDAKAYQQWVIAHQTNRGVVQAQRRAVRTPLEMCAMICAARKVSRWMKPRISPSLGSDLKAADAFLDAAFMAAQSMVRINCNAAGFPPVLKRATVRQLRKNV